MKYFLSITLLCLLAIGCKKDGQQDPPQGCPDGCPYTFVNLTPYRVELKFDGALKFILDSGERWDTNLTGSPLVEGDIQTPWAHNDYRKVLECPADCQERTLILIEL